MGGTGKKSAFEAHVGGRVVIEPVGVGERFQTEFLGWEKDKYLMVKLPAKKDVLGHPYQAKMVIVRCLHQSGQVLGFRSGIQAVIQAPQRILFLDYPETVEALSLRKMERVDCFLPAVLMAEGGQGSVFILDLSTGGCKASVAETGNGLLTHIAPQRQVTFDFKLPWHDGETPMQVTGVIRKVYDGRHKRMFAVVFDELDPQIRGHIEGYVRQAMEFIGPSRGAAGAGL